MSGSVEIEKRKCNIFFSRKPMKSRQLCPKYFKLTMYNVNMPQLCVQKERIAFESSDRAPGSFRH